MRTIAVWIIVSTVLILTLSQMSHADLFAGSLTTIGVKVDKLFLLPGETQFAIVTASNSASTQASITVEVSLNWDIAKTRHIGRATIVVPAGSEGSTTFSFPAGPDLFGYEVLATVPDDPTIAPASAYFSVHHNIWQVSMQGSGLTENGMQNPTTTLEQRETIAAGASKSLCNHLEFFAWAPDDFSELDPGSNIWYAGQTSYPASKLALHESIDALHSVGATVSAYAKGQMGGPEAFEFFRRNPIWAWAPYNSEWSVRDLKQFDAKSPFDMGDNRWPRSMTDFGSWPAALAHIKQLRMAANDFRFDAVRYDDHLQVGWVNDGYNDMSTRNMQQIITRLRSARPYFGFGFNWITSGVNATWARHGGSPTPDWPIACAAGSQIMDEEVGQIYGSSMPPQGLPWSDYLARLRSDRASAEPNGGKVFVMQNKRLPIVDSTYRDALVLALRMFHTNFDSQAPGQFALFATRYACLLRSDNPVDIASDQVHIVSGQPIWGNDMAYRYNLGNGRGRIVAHLFNPPPSANMGITGPRQSFPAPVQNVQLQIALPRGWKAESAESIETATLAATILPVEASTIHLTIPRVELWTVVVIDCKVAE